MPQVTASRLQVQEIREASRFLDLAEEWNGLVRRCSHPHLFNRHEWHAVWWRHLSQGRSPRILLVRDEDRLSGIAPFMFSWGRLLRTIPARFLEVISNYGYYRDTMVVEDGGAAQMEAVFSALADASDWDILVLHSMQDGYPDLEALPALCRRFGFMLASRDSAASPYLKLPGSWPDLHQSLGHELRSKLRRREKRLQGFGAVRHEALSRGDDPQGFLARIFELAKKGWAYREGTAICSTPQLTGYYRELATVGAERGWFDAHILSAGDQDVAFEYNFSYEGVISNLKLGYDPQFSTASPGHVLKRYVLEDAIRRGTTEYDMLGAPDAYKLEWTSTCRDRAQWLVFNRHAYARTLHYIQSRLRRPARKNGVSTGDEG